MVRGTLEALHNDVVYKSTYFTLLFLNNYTALLINTSKLHIKMCKFSLNDDRFYFTSTIW